MFDIKWWIRHHMILTTIIISILIISIVIGCFILIPLPYIGIGVLVLAFIMLVGGIVYSILEAWLRH